MPPAPLIPDPRLRAAVLTGLMATLLVLSLLAASWITGAPLTRPRPAAAPPVPLGGATLAPAPGWVLAQTYQADDGTDAGWELVDTTGPGRRLRIFRLEVPPDASPQTVLSQVLPQLIAGRRPITRFKTPEEGPARPDTFELFFSTRRFSLTGASGSPQTHAVATMRPDPQRCWVVQLTALVPSERWGLEAEVSQLHELRRMMQRITVNAP